MSMGYLGHCKHLHKHPRHDLNMSKHSGACLYMFYTYLATSRNVQAVFEYVGANLKAVQTYFRNVMTCHGYLPK